MWYDIVIYTNSPTPFASHSDVISWLENNGYTSLANSYAVVGQYMTASFSAAGIVTHVYASGGYAQLVYRPHDGITSADFTADSHIQWSGGTHYFNDVVTRMPITGGGIAFQRLLAFFASLKQRRRQGYAK